MKIESVVMAMLLYVELTNVEAQTVTVPSKSTMNFVKVATVSSPSLLKITTSGTISSGNLKGISPNGISRNLTDCQNAAIPCHPLPLHKSVGIDFKSVSDFGALVGYFVPKSTKTPSTLFFVGSYNEYIASEAGSLFLGINENDATDNKGSFSVQITSKTGQKISALTPVVVNGDDDVVLEVGQQLIVELDANITTGYSWSLVEGGESYLKSEGDTYAISPSCGDKVGCGGIDTFTYTAIKKGSGSLKLEYRRPWESGSPARTVSITYTVN